MISNLGKLLAASLVLLTLGVATASAQMTTTGRISGTVTDTTGAVVPGATVTAAEQGTGLTRSTTTNAQGAYIFVALPRGSYTVTAELSGFKKMARSGYVLVAGSSIGADFALEVGQLTDEVNVAAAAGEAVNTTSGEIARVVDRNQVQSLALNGRNYMQLATLVPGTPQLDLNALDIMTGLGINTVVNGSRNNTSLLMVDGGFNMDSGSNNSQISNVGIDFIEEVAIKTSNFAAEYGRNSGAMINVVTRSGGNKYFGTLYEYGRRDKLDANDYFANSKKVKKSKLDYNDFGWAVGGPIMKDKLFFFVGEEWKQIRRLTASTFRTLPTSAMRQGDFSALSTPIKDPLTGQQFPGNIIPVSRITTDGKALANVYSGAANKAVSYDDTLLTNNALFQDDNPFDLRQDVVRLDWQATQSQRLTLRYLHDDYVLTAPYGTFIDSQLPTIPTERKRPGYNIQLAHNWTLSPSLTNEFKGNAAWNGQRIPPTGDAWQRETYGFTFPQIWPTGGPYDNSIPNVDTQNYASYRGANGYLMSPTTDIAFGDTLTWLKSSHVVKGGLLVIRNRKDQNGRSVYPGQITFNPTGNPNSTGNAFADALLGNFRTYNESQFDPVGHFRFWQIEGFLQDSWRVSRSLSVDVGLRYAWHDPSYTSANNMASFDPSAYDPAKAVTVNTNGTLVPGSGDPLNGMRRAGDVPDSEIARVPNGNDPKVLAVPVADNRGFYESKSLFMPRLGFSWSPSANGKTAVRGGVGLFYDRPEGNLYFSLVNNAPYSSSVSYENGNLSAPGGGTVPAPAPLGNMDAIDPDLTIPRTWQWSLSVQRELGWGIFAEVSYIGSKGQNLLRQPDINQPSFEDLGANAAGPKYNTNYLRPYKGYATIRMRLTDADSRYDAMQLFLSRRRGAFLWTVAYTLGKSEDNASGNGDDPEDYKNKDYNWGPSNFDRRHIVVATWTWKIPVLRDQKGIAGSLLGGWELSGIGRYQSGAPLTVTGNTSIGVRRADLVAGQNPYLDELINPTTGAVQWLNPAAFSSAPEGRRGTSTRGQFIGPEYKVVDLALRKAFRLGETPRLVLQADFFNAFNTVNFNFNNQTIQSGIAGFGVITATAPPRQIQLGVKLQF